MKKNKAIALLSFGAMTTLVTTGSVVVSCGSSNADQQKLDGITSDMLKDTITKAMHPSDTVDPYTVPTGGKVEGISINGLAGVTITFKTWTTSWTSGSLSFSVNSISKGNAVVLGDKFGTITITGFKVTTTITKANVKDAEGNLWSWDDTTKSLTIFDGVTEITGPGDASLIWPGHDITTAKNINFPNTLKLIDDYVFENLLSTNLALLTIFASVTDLGGGTFLGLTTTSIKFLGDLPGTGTPIRTLVLETVTFGHTPITSIEGKNWQDWATANYPDAFKKP